MKRIPFKNYVIAILIVGVTFVITILGRQFYLNQKELSRTNINLNLSEIKVEELDNYIVDNHDVMIYIVDSADINKKIENNLNKIISKNNYNKDIVYFDLNKINKVYYNNFLKKYNLSSLDNNSLLIIKDEKVIKIKKITEKNVKKIKEYINVLYYEV